MARAAMKELVFNAEEPQEAAGTSNPTTYWATYRHFIEIVRRTYPPLEGPPFTLNFDIRLRTNSHQIKLRLDRCSFFSLGYQMETPRQWMEFGVGIEAKCPWRPSPKHFIAGSSLLGMQYDYKELESECGQTIESICLGQQQLTSAVDLLATSTCAGQDRVRSLIIVGLMICEAIRFSYFADYLATRFLDNLPTPLWMRKTLDIYHWLDPISCLRQCITPAGDNPDLSPGLNIPDAQACDVIGSDLSPCKDSLDLKPGNKEIPDANLSKNDLDQTPQTKDSDLVIPDALDSGCHHQGEGNPDVGPWKVQHSDISPDDETSNEDSSRSLQPVIGERSAVLCTLAEVFFVRLYSIEEVRPGLFYGNIEITDIPVPESIYNRGREEPDFVQPGDLISLTGPIQPITAGDSFSFKFVLMGKKSPRRIRFCTPWWRYNEPICRQVGEDHCSVSLCYIALQEAMSATLTVTFIDKGRKGHARLYGQLSASFGRFGYEIVLFQKKEDEYIDVRPEREIRLLRNVVSVPWNSQLVLRADLFENTDSPFDQEIAKDVLPFPLHYLSGSSVEFEKTMYRECTKIRVKVEWESGTTISGNVSDPDAEWIF